MQKRANEATEPLLIIASYLVLAAIVYFIITSTIPSEESFFKDYLVRDLGLTLDTLHNIPGNFKIKYSNINNINLEIREGVIAVKSVNEITPKIRHYTTDKNYKIDRELTLHKNSTLEITKNINSIYLESKNE